MKGEGGKGLQMTSCSLGVVVQGHKVGQMRKLLVMEAHIQKLPACCGCCVLDGGMAESLVESAQLVAAGHSKRLSL